eukprot:2832814-Pleurochrysis_carterae.AAC.1
MLHRHGNLWRFFTAAKLEARGARCKHIVRRQTSGRPHAADAGTQKKKHTIHKRGESTKQKRKGESVSWAANYKQEYDSSKMQQLLGLVELRESAPSTSLVVP